ncbi:hypothetical protein E2C01_046572 [Portunus trituberculatus]|uniref:Uncharacterized protein n=1 Tax=Portunus trituberculatus TaxID=210409 RepID=A0A5B7G5F6_PORTR|nr:hypothetical protein [Portunus trituberculatus]
MTKANRRAHQTLRVDLFYFVYLFFERKDWPRATKNIKRRKTLSCQSPYRADRISQKIGTKFDFQYWNVFLP